MHHWHKTELIREKNPLLSVDIRLWLTWWAYWMWIYASDRPDEFIEFGYMPLTDLVSLWLADRMALSVSRRSCQWTKQCWSWFFFQCSWLWTRFISCSSRLIRAPCFQFCNTMWRDWFLKFNDRFITSIYNKLQDMWKGSVILIISYLEKNIIEI